MLHVIMLIADQLQIDRRVLHEANSLANRGFKVSIVSLVSTMQRPVSTHPNVVILDASTLLGQKRSYGPGTGAVIRQKTIYKWAQRLLPRRLQEFIYFGYLDPAGRIARAFKDIKIERGDVIVAHDLPLLPLAVELRHKQGCGRIVFDAHELYDEQHDFLKTKTARRYWRRVEDQFLPLCNRVMTVTPRLAGILEKRHALPETPTVLFNACPYENNREQRDKLHQLYGIPVSRTIVLCQGGVSPGRSLEEFIEAWQYIGEPKPALVFLGFGREEYVRSLTKMVTKKNLGKDVFLGKAVAPDQVLEYTCGAKLGLISNRGQGINNTDGGPNRLFEYLQARVPVLSYEHNGVRQILNQTQTGWVVKWDSTRQLAEIIMEKLTEAQHISADSLEEAARKFCWEQEAVKLMPLFGENLRGEFI